MHYHVYIAESFWPTMTSLSSERAYVHYRCPCCW